ncbi:helix-turn-helix domain-containing protein [Paraburkholderia hayleyella]|uniref:helix-turn-helix domain-containing protein n=1 Tax=Paraburkholderia hayleyella TaxID=2152889 RepID=UPI001290A642|nr:LysR family transcriptional regulator [Paraburkholderia hayleyella]
MSNLKNIVRRNVATSRDLNWDLFRRFLQVTGYRSYTEAARGLGVHRPTVGQWIVDLEAALGLNLVIRYPGGRDFGLTPEGLKLRRLLIIGDARLSEILGLQPDGRNTRDAWSYVDEAFAALLQASKMRNR